MDDFLLMMDENNEAGDPEISKRRTIVPELESASGEDGSTQDLPILELRRIFSECGGVHQK